MSTTEQEQLKKKYYNEAIRYMDNAKESLKKAGKSNDFYADDKYVKVACGTAYSGVLKALDGYLYLKGVEKRKGRKSIDFYYENLGKLDKSLLKYFHSVYETLHLSGYYDGLCDAKVIQSGFLRAYEIINKIKPATA
ncbi:MAG: DUF5618 family protein [Bacteroidales bacterium]|nr:DUF5618 family protein [Bacteroidales bacterium]